MCEVIRKDKMENTKIQKQIGIAPTNDKMKKINWDDILRPIDSVVRSESIRGEEG